MLIELPSRSYGGTKIFRDECAIDATAPVRTIITLAKDARFYLRLSQGERRIFSDVGEALGCESLSQAVRFVMRQRYRELFGTDEPSRARQRGKHVARKERLRGA